MSFRNFAASNHESLPMTEVLSSLGNESASNEPHIELGDLESGRGRPTDILSVSTVAESDSEDAPFLKHGPVYPHSKVSKDWRTTGARGWRYGKRRRPRIGEGNIAGQPAHRGGCGRRSRALRCVFRLLLISLMLLGVFQLLAIILGALEAFFPDEGLDWVTNSWGEPSPDGPEHWPTDFSRDIIAIACHSHNDYWRRIALFSALSAGCTSVEADVWLFDEDLYVGHSVSSLTPNRTLESLYINPLLAILEKQNPITHFHPQVDIPPNGIFDTAPTQTLVLLIDFKTAGEALWPYVKSQLAPLRERNYLTYFNGKSVVERPITIVATGNAPFDLLVSDPAYRDIFFDAPLDQMASIDPSSSLGSFMPESPTPSYDDEPINTTLASAPTHTPNAPLFPSDSESQSESSSSNPNEGQGHSGHAPEDPTMYNRQNSYYASVSFSKTVGFPWRSRLSFNQLQLIRAQVRGAHAQGLKVRYWSIPAWPRGLRNYIWRVLIREGVDMLSVDDLGEHGVWADFGPRKGGWGGKWWS